MLNFFLLTAHLAVSALVFLGIKLHILKVHPYLFPVALLLPFWGALLVLVLHFQILFRADDCVEVGVERLKLESELYKSIPMEELRSAGRVVPIEEALVVNTAGERRALIMDILNDNPKEYVRILQKAGNNEDTEVVHYAVTAMVEIAQENDFKLQDFERRYAMSPNDTALLDEYTAFLWSCLSQNLMQGQVEVLNRELFGSLMQKKLQLKAGSIADYQQAVKNELQRKNYTNAALFLQQMQKLYPEEEAYYLSRLDYLAALRRGDDIGKLIAELEEKRVYLSTAAKEVLAFWKT